MGHKVHPGGLRVGIIHTWKSNWFTSDKDFPGYLAEDIKIRDHIYGKLSHAGLSDIHIRKDKQRITVDIYTARPGIVIGKSGSEVDALRKELHGMTGKSVQVNITEIKRPELDAKLVAQSIAEQLQNRVSFRRAMKRSLSSSMRSGAHGRQDPLRRPPGRLRDVAVGAVLRGPRPAAHAARRHRLRLRRGEDHLRPDRRQGLDQQGRDHARGLRARRPADAPGRRRRTPPPRRPSRRHRGARPHPPLAARWRRWRRRRRSAAPARAARAPLRAVPAAGRGSVRSPTLRSRRRRPRPRRRSRRQRSPRPRSRDRSTRDGSTRDRCSGDGRPRGRRPRDGAPEAPAPEAAAPEARPPRPRPRPAPEAPAEPSAEGDG